MGRKLAAARKAAGLSQQALADATGVSKAMISMMEGGFRTPRIDLLVRLAAALDVPPADLLPDLASHATAPAAPQGPGAHKVRARAETA